MTYDIGDRVELNVDFQDNDGNDVDPSEVVLIILRPSGQYTHVTWDIGDELSPITKVSTGHFAYVHTAQESGQHDYRWRGKGSYAKTEEGRFWVSLNKLTAFDT